MEGQSHVPGEVLIVKAERLCADWSRIREKLAEGLGGAGVAELAGAAFGVPPVASAFGLAGAIRMDLSGPGDKAHQLLATALAEAMERVAEHVRSRALRRNERRALTRQSELQLEQDVRLTKQFFLAPESVEAIRRIRDHFVDYIAPLLDRKEEEARTLRAMFDDALLSAIDAERNRNVTLYKEIEKALDSPFAEAWKRKVDWARYSQNVISAQWTEPLFNDADLAFGLDQVYVPLTAENRVPRRKAAGDPDENKVHLLDFDAEFDRWVRDEDREGDRVRLVTGGPGSGKSSLLKALAYRTTAAREDTNDWHTVFVPLHRHEKFQFGAQDLEQAIRGYLEAEGFRRDHDPFTDDDPRRLLLLFDGLDELALPTDGAALEQARDMVTAVLVTVNRLAGRRRVKAVVSGRTGVMQTVVSEDRATAIDRGQLYRVQPYDTDQRAQAEERYQAALGLSLDALPAILDDRAYAGLTREPLLHAFIMLSHGRLSQRPPLGLEGNRAYIYEALFGSVFDRDVEGCKPGWQMFWRSGDSKEQAEDRFFGVLEALGLGAYRDGDPRQARFDAVKAALEETGFGDLVDEIGNSTIARLAATFFARLRPGGGVEFHHKTLGEFLYVRRLGRWVEEYGTRIPMADHAGLGDTARREAFETWRPLADEHRMTDDVLEFLKDELFRRAGDWPTARSWHEALRPVFERALAQGWQHGATQREAERRSVNAEEALFCAWRWLCPAEPEDESQRCVFPLGRSALNLRDFISRQGAVHGSLRRKSEGLTNFQSLNSLRGADLRGADLEYMNFAGTNLMGANLGGAELGASNLTGVNFVGADLKAQTLKERN